MFMTSDVHLIFNGISTVGAPGACDPKHSISSDNDEGFSGQKANGMKSLITVTSLILLSGTARLLSATGAQDESRDQRAPKLVATPESSPSGAADRDAESGEVHGITRNSAVGAVRTGSGDAARCGWRQQSHFGERCRRSLCRRKRQAGPLRAECKQRRASPAPR